MTDDKGTPEPDVSPLAVVAKGYKGYIKYLKDGGKSEISEMFGRAADLFGDLDALNAAFDESESESSESSTTVEEKSQARPPAVRTFKVTNEIRAVKFNPDLPMDKRALAKNIEEMRNAAKGQGIATDTLDEYAREALEFEKKND